MFALRFTSLFFLFSTASLVAASPTPVAEALSVDKRASSADVSGVVTTLQTSVGSILPQIDSLVSSGSATDQTVTPLIGQLTTALDTAVIALGELPLSRKRQSTDQVANLVAGIIKDITTTLDGLTQTASTVPGLGGLLAGVDTSLNQVLIGLETLLAGVLNLVANLLVDVAGLLRSLALGLTLATLGL
ncbi:unnamed protein product [Mycena citricolor]|uniref:Sc15 protein n=1 Tax=Mycena citricolor TaxID=2018698 RepID=A0AAD2HJR9_9AGAR|nr:unnamed protein product [Mycena citricolor]CAK5277795.1 unnamed protein product [Mycena citricolor]